MERDDHIRNICTIYHDHHDDNDDNVIGSVSDACDSVNIGTSNESMSLPYANQSRADFDVAGGERNNHSVFVNNATGLVNYISNLWNNMEFSDVVLKSGTEVFHLHRLVLSQSAVFSTMLNSSMWQEGKSLVVELHEIDCYAGYIKRFLQYMYTGAIWLTWENIEAMIYFSDKYAVNALLKRCLEFIKHYVETSGDIIKTFDCWKMIHNLLSHRSLAECESVNTFILDNFELIKCSDTLIERMDEDDLKFFLASDTVVARTEFTVFKTLEKWLMTQPDNRERLEQFKKLVPLVRFPYMRVQELAYAENSPNRIFSMHAASCDTATASLKTLLCDAYKYHLLAAEQRRLSMHGLPRMRCYLEGNSSMPFRLRDTYALSTWSKIEQFFEVNNSMSNADSDSTSGFRVTLMRKINAATLASKCPKSLLSLEISQLTNEPMWYSLGRVYVHEKRGPSVVKKVLTQFILEQYPVKVVLPDILSYDDIVKETLYSYLSADDSDSKIYLALDIALVQ